MHNLQKCFLKTVAPTVFQGSSSNKTRSESSERSLKESTKAEGTSLANGSKSKELSRLGTSTMFQKITVLCCAVVETKSLLSSMYDHLVDPIKT